MRLQGSSLSQQHRGEVTLLGHLHKGVQGGECLIVPPLCLLQLDQGRVAQPDLIGVDQVRPLQEGHALCQVVFGCLQLVPLAQQVAQTKVVSRAVDQAMESLWPQDHLHNLFIGSGSLPESPLETLPPG